MLFSAAVRVSQQLENNASLEYDPFAADCLYLDMSYLRFVICRGNKLETVFHL